MKAYFEFAVTLNKCFCRKKYTLYMKAEQLLLTAATTGYVITENMKEVCWHFSEDLDECLKNQHSVLSDVIQGASPSLKVIQPATLSLNTSSLFSEVLKLLKLLFVLAASTASAERSSPSLRRLKTYLRSSVTA